MKCSVFFSVYFLLFLCWTKLAVYNYISFYWIYESIYIRKKNNWSCLKSCSINLFLLKY
jgi:hypothetical protein